MKRHLLLLALTAIISTHVWADATMPLNFTAVNGAATIALDSVGTPSAISLQYSTDSCTTWNTYTIGDTINLANGAKVYFKALNTNLTFSTTYASYYNFKMSGTISADGNIMSLLDETMTTTTVPGDGFLSLFQGCTSLTHAPSLPATTLNPACYQNLFNGCTSLTQAPVLPATTVYAGSYQNMFYNCSSLTQAPALPATTLADACYLDMFKYCISLTQAPALPATSLATACYSGMFAYCISLTQAPALPATILANNCYWAMFQYCSSLTQAPALPATSLAYCCYVSMFYGCTSLTQAPALPATSLANGCYSNMFVGCTSLTQAPALPATTLTDNGYWRMFEDCSSLTHAPALPATSLANKCYLRMFANCSSLELAPALPASNLADSCYLNMFYGCTSLTQVPALPATSLANGCYYKMFFNCCSLEVNLQAPGTQWSIPATTAGNYSVDSMFAQTAGTMNGTPSLNTTYYIASDLNYGTIGDNLYWSLDIGSGELLFSGSGSIPDYSPTLHAPWYHKRSLVNYVTMPAGVISRIGNYAFDGCTNLYYAELNADTLGESLFNGCSNFTLCYSETTAHANANTLDGCTTTPVLIADSVQWYEHLLVDSLGLAVTLYPHKTDYTQDSLLTLNAIVTLRPSHKGICVIASRQDVNGTPMNITDDCDIIWKETPVAPLVYEFYSQGVAYFGKNSFAGCTTLHNITASPKYWGSSGSYSYAYLDSIHADAFDSITPDIVDLYEETKYQPARVNHYLAQKTNLSQTLLYVPDTLAATGKTMLDQYTATSFWNDNFADISNKSLVDTQYVDTAYADIYFYYQEAIDSVPVVEYHLVLYKIGGTDTADVYFNSDTSFVIARIPRIIMIIDSVTGSTTTITISIDHAAYNPNIQEVNIHMEHLAKNSTYSVTLSPLDELGNALVTDTCTMTTTTETSLPVITYNDDEIFFPTANTDVYLITGQYIGKYTLSLPPGVYLMREEKRWYKFVIGK